MCAFSEFLFLPHYLPTLPFNSMDWHLWMMIYLYPRSFHKCLGQNSWESQAFGASQSSKLPLRSTKREEEMEQTETRTPREQCITTVLQYPLEVSPSIRDKVHDLRESTWLVQTSWLISRWQKLVRWIPLTDHSGW